MVNTLYAKEKKIKPPMIKVVGVQITGLPVYIEYRNVR